MGAQGDYRWQRRVVALEASGGHRSRIVGGRGEQWGGMVDTEAEWWAAEASGGWQMRVVGGKCEW